MQLITSAPLRMEKQHKKRPDVVSQGMESLQRDYAEARPVTPVTRELHQYPTCRMGSQDGRKVVNNHGTMVIVSLLDLGLFSLPNSLFMAEINGHLWLRLSGERITPSHEGERRFATGMILQACDQNPPKKDTPEPESQQSFFFVDGNGDVTYFSSKDLVQHPIETTTKLSFFFLENPPSCQVNKPFKPLE